MAKLRGDRVVVSVGANLGGQRRVKVSLSINPKKQTICDVHSHKNGTSVNPTFSYRHLYYFWVVAQEGGISHAAARLGMAVQTVSAQVRELERSLGVSLLKPQGRGLVLTEAGQLAARQADQIFALGEQLADAVRSSASAPVLRLAVGVSDGLPKLVVHRLLQPALQTPHLRLSCQEHHFEELLGQLALHRLDVVLADRPAPTSLSLRVYSHALGASPMAWYAPAALAGAARKRFPQSLAEVPVLLPTHHAAVRAGLDHWFERIAVQPRIVGEFEDSALLKTFGAAGMGVFPAAEWMHEELTQRYGVKRIGLCEGVHEHFYAIGTEKKVQHPLVQKLLPAQRTTQ
jgi:LysR family transcriptional regulator, transcriptional activator of nhaA